jgi:hypothetical protein
MINGWNQSLNRQIMSCARPNPHISLANAHKSCSFIVMLSCNILRISRISCTHVAIAPPHWPQCIHKQPVLSTICKVKCS